MILALRENHGRSEYGKRQGLFEVVCCAWGSYLRLIGETHLHLSSRDRKNRPSFKGRLSMRSHWGATNQRIVVWRVPGGIEGGQHRGITKESGYLFRKKAGTVKERENLKKRMSTKWKESPGDVREFWSKSSIIDFSRSCRL